MTAVSRTLAVVGVGLIGASLAAALRNRFAAIVGIDASHANAAYARENGLVDRVADDPLAALAADVVVVAAPVDATGAILRAFAAAGAARRPALIIDVASLQGPFVPFMRELPTFVTTHPMAGSERSGPAAADAALFRGRTWLVEPHADPAVRAELAELIAATGAALHAIEAAAHDELTALLSHLPQALAVVLGSVASAPFAGASAADAAAIAGPGLASMLRLARSSPAVWEPIFAANRIPVARSLRAAAAAAIAAADGLDAGNPAPLMSYFPESRPAVSATERFAPRVR